MDAGPSTKDGQPAPSADSDSLKDVPRDKLARRVEGPSDVQHTGIGSISAEIPTLSNTPPKNQVQQQLEIALVRRIKELEESRAEYSIRIRKLAKEWVESETAALDDERNTWNTRKEALEEETGRIKEENDRIKQENKSLLARVKQLEDSRAEYSVQIRKHAKEWVDNKTTVFDAERKLWETRRAALEEENSRLKEECRSLRALVKEEDGVSGAELKQAIIDLRVNINALGNLFLDRWDQKRRRVNNDINRVPKSLMKLLGARFIERMCHQTSPDPTILDYVAQACMVHYITDVIHCFCYGLTDEQNMVSQEVYEEIYQKEPIFVSSQWRTLAHMYGKLTIKDQEKAVAKRMASELFGHLENIDSFIGGQGGRIQSKFGRDVDDIVESTIRLITMLKENVSPAIYEVYCPREGVFEYIQMQDVLGKAQSGEVLCTAEMGLFEFTPKDGKFVEDGLVLLKAKVIVEKPGARATNKPARPRP